MFIANGVQPTGNRCGSHGSYLQALEDQIVSATFIKTAGTGPRWGRDRMSLVGVFLDKAAVDMREHAELLKDRPFNIPL